MALTSSSHSSPSDLHQILRVPLDQVVGHAVNIQNVASPRNFRFIDCKAICDQNTLRILECPNLRLHYSVISYVWEGNPLVDPSRKPPSFVVAGAEDGDPISLNVLRTACIAAIKCNTRYLWLDRVCIMQGSEDDQSWQIRNMAKIYKNCNTCFVLPGGLRRLVGLGEETAWINRSWTLQEALFPKTTLCLFRWRQQSGSWNGVTAGQIECVEQGRSAMAQLNDLVQACVATHIEFDRKRKSVRILGSAREPLMALNGAMNLKDADGREAAIWRSMLMRTSKRDIDVIFSVMGLFGVTLDPSNYRNGDRLMATLALAEAIMKKGGKANWICASLALPIPRNLCTLPELPAANAQGSAFLITPDRRRIEVRTKMKDLDWYLKDAPGGSMDSDGFLHFTGQMSPITSVTKNRFDSKYNINWGFESWAVIKSSDATEPEAFFSGSMGTHAIVVGKMCHFQLTSTSARADTRDSVLMLVTQNTGGTGWHKTGMAAVHPTFTRNWKMQRVAVGNDVFTLYFIL